MADDTPGEFPTEEHRLAHLAALDAEKIYLEGLGKAGEKDATRRAAEVQAEIDRIRGGGVKQTRLAGEGTAA